MSVCLVLTKEAYGADPHGSPPRQGSTEAQVWCCFIDVYDCFRERTTQTTENDKFQTLLPEDTNEDKRSIIHVLVLVLGISKCRTNVFFGRKLSHFLLRSSLPCKLSQNKLNLFFNERPHLVYLPQYALCAAVIDSNCFISS